MPLTTIGGAIALTCIMFPVAFVLVLIAKVIALGINGYHQNDAEKKQFGGMDVSNYEE